jgi:tRNA(Ile)-lysidine synthase
MPRSHPPTLISIVERTLREECGDVRNQAVLVAVSGGPDSQALLHVLARVAPRLRIQVLAHGVDHGLRPEARRELATAAQLARSLGVPFSESRVSLREGGNLQARARAARYRALEVEGMRLGAGLIATAHHADDRAETVLLRILRGSGLGGLAVLPPRTGNRLRPMVRARKSDVVAHVSRHALPHATDPSNANRRFLRVRVRLELMPLLESLSPRVVEHLTALADELHESPPPVVLDASGEPVPLARAHLQAIRRMLERRECGGRVLLPAGREVRFDPELGRAMLAEPGARSEKPGPAERPPFRKRRK